jgi:hypothetical protein
MPSDLPNVLVLVFLASSHNPSDYNSVGRRAEPACPLQARDVASQRYLNCAIRRITGPQGTHQLADLVQSDFLRWDDTFPENNRLAWQAALAPNGLINALFKKTVDSPFRISLDTTTTAGDVAEELAANYRIS